MLSYKHPFEEFSMHHDLPVVNLKQPARVATDKEVDELLQALYIKPRIKMREYDVATVLAFIEKNRLPDGMIQVYDYTGIYTKWCRDLRNTITPELTSKLHDVQIDNAFAIEGHNAAGAYQRVVYRSSESRLASGKILYLERMGAEETSPWRLASNEGWVNLARIPDDQPLPKVHAMLDGVHVPVYTEPADQAVRLASANTLL
jgi:hypothetical protein